MKKYYPILLLLLLSTSITAQNLWPGDINNNGIANRNDFLYLGLSIGQSDSSRASASINWQAQAAPIWSTTIPGLPNISGSFADTDGDGTVDSLDAAAIIQNYGLTHGIPIPDAPSTTNAAAPPLFFDNNPAGVGPGDTVRLTLQLGTTANPAVAFHGLAFQLRIDSSLVVPGSMELEFDSTFFAAPSLSYSRIVGPATLDAVITRTNQSAASGSGTVASLSFIIEDDLFGTPSTVVEIDSVIILDAAGQKLDANPQNSTVYFYINGLPRQTAASARIYPNPNRGHFWLERTTAKPITIRLFDALGRCQWERLSTEKMQEIQLPKLPTGQYWLEVDGEIHPLILGQ